MSAASEQMNSGLENLTQGLKDITLIIGQHEMLNITISNLLDRHFDFPVHTSECMDEGVQYLTDSNVNLVIIDTDNVAKEAVDRVYKILGHLQVPCLFIGSDPSYLNELKEGMDNSFASFLPKTILHTMLKDTVTLLLEKTGAPQKMYKRFLAVSNHKKPLTFYILATVLLIEPLLKVLYLKLNTGFEWEVLVRTIMSIEGVASNFEFWALFPLAGYALLSVSSWSFLFFIGLQAYSAYAYFSYEQFTWPYVAESPFISVSFLVVVNTILVFYFAVPTNRRPYWNQMRRVWRNTSRYTTNLKSYLKLGKKSVETTITNISETGAYFTSSTGLEIGQKMQLEIPINGELRSLDAVVRRAQETAHEDFYGYGVEFDHRSRSEKKILKDFVNSLNQRIQ